MKTKRKAERCAWAMTQRLGKRGKGTEAAQTRVVEEQVSETAEAKNAGTRHHMDNERNVTNRH